MLKNFSNDYGYTVLWAVPFILSLKDCLSALPTTKRHMKSKGVIARN
jgi:hypothetical protein